ncbi:MAG: hypothetical protein ACKOJH_02690, partial [Actinomycetota bacterium]
MGEVCNESRAGGLVDDIAEGCASRAGRGANGGNSSFQAASVTLTAVGGGGGGGYGWDNRWDCA